MRGLLIIGLTTALVLTAGIGSIRYLEKTANELSALLEKVQAAVLDENWRQAERQLDETSCIWESVQPKWSAIINHTEVDDIRVALRRVEQYVAHRDKTAALVELAVVKLLIKHIPEKEKPTWSNIL